MEPWRCPGCHRDHHETDFTGPSGFYWKQRSRQAEGGYRIPPPICQVPWAFFEDEKIHQKKLTWQSKKYPEFRGSGSDAAIVCTWLESVLAPHANHYRDLCTVLWTSNRCMRLFYSAERFLSEQERNTVRILGRVFCRMYLNKAGESVQQHALLWRVGRNSIC